MPFDIIRNKKLTGTEDSRGEPKRYSIPRSGMEAMHLKNVIE